MFQEKNYRDKENFKKNYEENMKMLRESVGVNGYQYYSVGDMNHDGKVDFAVLLVDSSSKDTDEFPDFALAIFNAPFKKGQSPAYFEQNLSGVTNSYIVYDLMTEKHLFLGKFESDVYAATYYPKGKTHHFSNIYGRVACLKCNGGIEQINGREGETATLLSSCVELKRAWRRFRPTSSQALDPFTVKMIFIKIRQNILNAGNILPELREVLRHVREVLPRA